MVVRTTALLNTVSKFTVVDGGTIVETTEYDSVADELRVSAQTAPVTMTITEFDRVFARANEWRVLVAGRFVILSGPPSSFMTEIEWKLTTPREMEMKHTVAGILFRVTLADIQVTVHPHGGGVLPWRDWRRMVDAHRDAATLMLGG